MIGQLFDLAIQHQQAGRLAEAERLYRQILAQQPAHVESIHFLGMIAYQVGRHDAALDLIRRSIALRPDWAIAYNNLGLVLRDSGQIDRAMAAFRHAIVLDSGHADAYSNLSAVLREQGMLDEAVAVCRRAIALRPDYPEAYCNLGNALRDQGRLDDAIAAHRQAIAIRPGYCQAYCNLGNALADGRRLDEAIAAYAKAIALDPKFAEAHHNLGIALQRGGHFDQAVAAFSRAIALRPHYADAYCNLGHAYREIGHLSQAVAACRQAIVLDGGLAAAHCHLGMALGEMGQLDEAVAAFERAVSLEPSRNEANDNLLLTLQYCPDITPDALAEAHAQFDRRLAAPLRGAVVSHANDRDARRRLRVGFVSPDFGSSSVACFFDNVLENLSRELLETICYSNRLAKDGITHRIQAAATLWRDVAALGDEQLAEQIRADRIDILFDLSGHTAGNRLGVFARKPAPIQITWLGYVGTTGLRAMDYVLADGNLILPEEEKYYCEHVLRMPHDYACYSAPADAPATGPLPALTRGFATFGSFNNLSKINPRVIDAWASILLRAPRSRLVIRNRSLADAQVRNRYFQLFADRGIGAERVDLLGWSPFATRMDLYNQIDIALDPFPYSGATTTCDALWMGVPVISCPGKTFASRQSLTHLLALGADELVARDLPDYVDRAVNLAGNLSRLAKMRAGLRQRMLASPLMNSSKFARDFETVCRRAWHARIETVSATA